MQKNQLKAKLAELTIDQLKTLEDSLQVFLFSQGKVSVGEDYHPSYKKNRKLYKELLRKTVHLHRNIEKYFKDQWYRINTLVNLTKIQATQTEDQYLYMEYWKEEDKTFAATIEIDIAKIFEVGALATELQNKISTGVDSKNDEVQRFLRNYTLNLAGDINKTTRDRILQQIQTSIKIGENRNQLSDRIEEIVLDPKRAVKIAQTESIRAYSEGTLSVGKRIGAKTKTWRTVSDPCPICSSFSDQTIPFDDLFGGQFSGPPAHPHCRCRVEIIVDPKDIDWSRVGEASKL